MNYYTSSFPVLASSTGVSYEIYLSGCYQNCKGCHSSWTHDFSAGQVMDKDFTTKLMNDLSKKSPLYDNIVILGGEPMDQDLTELVEFLQLIRDTLPAKGLWIYTSYERDEIPEPVVDLVDYFKCGKFDIDKLNPDSKKGWYDDEHGLYLATSNQYISKGGWIRI